MFVFEFSLKSLAEIERIFLQKVSQILRYFFIFFPLSFYNKVKVKSVVNVIVCMDS